MLFGAPSPLVRWLILLLALPVSASAEQPFAFATTPGQLPKAIVPRHYDLHLQPDLANRTTAGTVRIEFEALSPVTEVVLNALELEIDAARLLNGDSAPVPLSARLDAEKQTLTLPVALAAGRHVLEIDYRGRIGTQARGFFVDEYVTPAGVAKLMLGTQMEPTDARRVLPCWDEPVYRATFDLTLVIPDNLMGVSNMPVVREERGAGGRKTVTFARTPAMPVYLLAICAAEFEVAEDEFEGVQLRVLTTEGKRASAAYALESTKRILAWFHDYFGMRYTLPKLDQIAVPNAFSGFGAMENWGCITYIDTLLLFDPATGSQADRENVFEVIAHEIAHQWFGNIVTMAWWDNLWLNEGFASWIGTKVTDALNPGWQTWLRANAVKESAMDLDARASTHPVLQTIANEMQAANAFDDISYEKGQSILRMLETWLGEAAFRDGIRHYLRQHAFSNTTTADLWRALETTSGRPVSTVANDWIERGGFPVVTVTAATVGDQPSLALLQTRFSLHATDAATPPWPIPITALELAPGAQPQTQLFDTAGGRLSWSGAPVKLNAGNTGFYRVHYDDTLAAALRDHLHLLPLDDRLNLLSDTWALVRAHRVTAPHYLELATRIEADAHPVLVEQVIGTFEYIDKLQRGLPGRHAFQTWACAVLQPVMTRLGRTETPGESPLDVALRAKLIRLFGNFGDRPTLAWAHTQFDVFLQDPTAVSGNLAGPMLHLVGRHADAATHAQLHDLARRSLTTAEKRRAYAGMQAATDPDLVRTTLALTLSGAMPAAEANRNLGRLAATCEQPEIVLDYALRHFDVLLARLGSFEAYDYLPGIMDAFADEARAEQLLRLTAEKFPDDAVTIAARTAEAIRDNARFKQTVLPEIDAWIHARLTSEPE